MPKDAEKLDPDRPFEYQRETLIIKGRLDKSIQFTSPKTGTLFNVLKRVVCERVRGKRNIRSQLLHQVSPGCYVSKNR